MKTISFKFKCNEDVRQILDEQARIYSSMVRYSFNRYKDGKSYKEVYNILGTVFQICPHILEIVLLDKHLQSIY